MKTCKKCNIEKEMTLFKKVKDAKDGYSNSCKECDAIANREYKNKNKDKVAKKKKEWREKNKDHISKMDKIWRKENKEHRQEYISLNKEHRQEYERKWREENKESISERGKKYYSENKDKVNDRIKNRMKTDNLFKLKANTGNMIRKSLRCINSRKSNKTSEILGCSFEEFKLHLESQFEDWMTWDNRALYNGELDYGWDIDHKIPLASAETEEDIIRLNHYTNLQPLCSYTNRHIKSDRLDYNK